MLQVRCGLRCGRGLVAVESWGCGLLLLLLLMMMMLLLLLLLLVVVATNRILKVSEVGKGRLELKLLNSKKKGCGQLVIHSEWKKDEELDHEEASSAKDAVARAKIAKRAATAESDGKVR